MHYLAAVPGRKNLIWVSSSFPFTVGLDDAFESGRMSRGGMLPWKTVKPEPEIAEFRVVVADHPRALIGSLRLPHTVKPNDASAAQRGIAAPQVR
jgi:hypothetical protein